MISFAKSARTIFLLLRATKLRRSLLILLRAFLKLEQVPDISHSTSGFQSNDAGNCSLKSDFPRPNRKRGETECHYPIDDKRKSEILDKSI